VLQVQTELDQTRALLTGEEVKQKPASTYSSEILFQHHEDLPWLAQYFEQKFPQGSSTDYTCSLFFDEYTTNALAHIRESRGMIASLFDYYLVPQNRKDGIRPPAEFAPTFAGIMGEIATKTILEDLLAPLGVEFKIHYTDVYMDLGQATKKFTGETIDQSDLIIELMLKKALLPGDDYVENHNKIFLFLNPSLESYAKMGFSKKVLKLPLRNPYPTNREFGSNRLFRYILGMSKKHPDIVKDVRLLLKETDYYENFRDVILFYMNRVKQYSPDGAWKTLASLIMEYNSEPKEQILSKIPAADQG